MGSLGWKIFWVVLSIIIIAVSAVITFVLHQDLGMGILIGIVCFGFSIANIFGSFD
jgi:hypothetical protein